MKRIKTKFAGLLVLLCLALFWRTFPVQAAPIEMEIFYLPHRPAMEVADKVEKLAGEFVNVTIRKYDFDDPGSRRLVDKYHLRGHMPVAVFINGKNRFTIDGREFRLQNFPKGDAFVPMFAGEWDYADLKAILINLSGEK